MQIRGGAYYRTRGGDIVGPMAQGKDKRYPWIIFSELLNSLRWNPDGDYTYAGEHSLDLVTEVYVSDTPPVNREITDEELRKNVGDQQRKAAAILGSPETKTVRDELAMEAMKLLWPKHGTDWREIMLALDAYKLADAMIEARKK